MKPSVACIVLIVLMPSLNGCLQNIKSRDCPAFDHPLARQWQPVESGNQVVFSHADGESAVYLLQSITSSEPYVAKIDVNSSALETPICEMTLRHVFSADDGSHEITMEFVQDDNDGINPAQDALAVKMEANLPMTALGEPGLLFSRTQYENLLTPHTVVSDVSLQPQFFASRTLDNGQTYSDVIVFPGISLPSDPDFDQYSLKEILLARDFGLIQISRNNGNVYTIVPE